MTNMLQEKVVGDSSIKKRQMKRLVILLRIFTLLATTAATVVMALNKETRTFEVATIGNAPVKINIVAKFQHTPANIMFVIANGVVTLHSLLMLSLALVSHKYDFKGLRFLIVAALDMVMIALVSGAATAVAFMGELARNGNSHARWNKLWPKNKPVVEWPSAEGAKAEWPPPFGTPSLGKPFEPTASFDHHIRLIHHPFIRPIPSPFDPFIRHHHAGNLIRPRSNKSRSNNSHSAHSLFFSPSV
ncbi:hypothetical protein E3N88_04068 [Mikania micrantha]|uniref:CASP-like protein n=1 Tax=Mikania micrantha TaxID=192012 RepID=A0A5N6PW77_9ASTR|nr:hypothetical protein E3N88_04068 [Mikania micrantha]